MPANGRNPQTFNRKHWLLAAAIVIGAAAALYTMGHPLVCKCGYVKLWHGVPLSSENSQHVSDWYTFSHVIHGFGFYALLWLIGRRCSLAARFGAATFLESAWEVFENTDFVINRYREVTISLDYYGDSVLNSVCDIAAMMVGFGLASRLPIWATIALTVALEAFVAYWIRDNLLLNIIMLVYPLESIRAWQAGG